MYLPVCLYDWNFYRSTFRLSFYEIRSSLVLGFCFSLYQRIYCLFFSFIFCFLMPYGIIRYPSTDWFTPFCQWVSPIRRSFSFLCEWNSTLCDHNDTLIFHYFCTVNGNSRAMICTLSSAHWQQASKFSALQRFESIRKKIQINGPINTIIIIYVSVCLSSKRKSDRSLTEQGE